MAKISALTELAAGAVAADDYVPVVDTSATATKKVKVENLQHFKVYRALLTQTGTDAPVATVLQNTLGGTLVWSRDGAGQYSGTLAGAFPASKVSNFSKRAQASPEDEIGLTVRGKRLSDDIFEIKTFYPGDTLEDDALAGEYVEILVYP